MLRKIIQIDTAACSGCGLCASACREGAIAIIAGKAVLVRDDYCDGLGNCLPACPQDAIHFIEREADAYNAAAVERRKKAEAAAAALRRKTPDPSVGDCASYVQKLSTRPLDETNPASAMKAPARPLGESSSSLETPVRPFDETSSSSKTPVRPLGETSSSLETPVRPFDETSSSSKTPVRPLGETSSFTQGMPTRPLGKAPAAAQEMSAQSGAPSSLEMPTRPQGMPPVSLPKMPVRPFDKSVSSAVQAPLRPFSVCPGSAEKQFDPAKAASVSAEIPPRPLASPSELTHWPVQIRLLSPRSSFFSGADLLIAADCTAYAYGNFHRDFIRGRIVLIGCPKLDDIDYSEKLSEIFRDNDIKSIMVVRMEVPCCGGLERAVRTALAFSGKSIPCTVQIVTSEGDLL